MSWILLCAEVGKAGFKDGIGAEAHFNSPRDLSVLRYLPEQDTVYVADEGNNAVRRIVASTALTQEEEPGRRLLGTGKPPRQSAMKVKTLQPQKTTKTLQPQKTKLVGSAAEEEPEEEPAEEPAATDADQEEVQSQTAPAVYRFTTPGGTAGADVQCAFPFIFDGKGYNDCTNTTKPEFGITESKFVQEGDVNTDSWCRTSESDSEGIAMGWGPCMPAGYMPDKCVVTAWTGWSRCGEVCGGSTSFRSRTVAHEGASQSECPHLNETKVCNAHACADTSTIAGGFTTNGDELIELGLGFVDVYSSPDLTYRPRSISTLRHNNTDIIFLSGDPTKSARIRRVDVNPSTGTCSVATDSSNPPVHVQVLLLSFQNSKLMCTVGVPYGAVWRAYPRSTSGWCDWYTAAILYLRNHCSLPRTALLIR